MRALREAIETFGRGAGQDVVKVDMFLNHRVDTALLFQMGEALAEEFRAERPTLVLTIEASGIALAVATAHALGDLPVVFAKKGRATNQSADMAETTVHSFTHQCDNAVRVDKRYLPIGSRVLIVDDFLAEGNAVHGLIALAESLDCKVCGVGVAVEKGFQPGGRALREAGVHLKSLAVVASIEGERITLAADD